MIRNFALCFSHPCVVGEGSRDRGYHQVRDEGDHPVGGSRYELWTSGGFGLGRRGLHLNFVIFRLRVLALYKFVPSDFR